MLTHLCMLSGCLCATEAVVGIVVAVVDSFVAHKTQNIYFLFLSFFFKNRKSLLTQAL